MACAVDMPMAVLERTEVDYTDARSKARFGAATGGLNHQYASLYFTRLNTLRAPVHEAAKRRWGELAKTPIKTLDVEPEVEAVIIGTLYKDMPGKPRALQAIIRKCAGQSASVHLASRGSRCRGWSHKLAR